MRFLHEIQRESGKKVSKKKFREKKSRTIRFVLRTNIGALSKLFLTWNFQVENVLNGDSLFGVLAKEPAKELAKKSRPRTHRPSLQRANGSARKTRKLCGLNCVARLKPGRVHQVSESLLERRVKSGQIVLARWLIKLFFFCCFWICPGTSLCRLYHLPEHGRAIHTVSWQCKHTENDSRSF